MIKSQHFALQHEILTLDAYLKGILEDRDRETLMKDFLDKLLTTLRMEALGPLQIFDATDMRAPGWSFILPITTSHITGHYFIKPGKKPHIHMDIYSCASVNWRKAIEVIDEFFRLDAGKASFIFRYIDEAKREIWALQGEGADILEEQQIVFEDESADSVINEDEPSIKEIAAKKVAAVYNAR